MNDKLILNLGGKVVEVTQDDNNRYSLNDLYKASGAGRTKNPSSFFRYVGAGVEVKKAWELRKRENSLCENTTGDLKLTCKDFDKYVIQAKVNRVTVTFAPLTIVYKYAAFISKEFEDSVYKAFTELSKGNVEEAIRVVESVAVPPEVIEKQREMRDKLNSIIKDKYGSDQRVYTNFNKLVCKVVTGYFPSELTGKNGSSVEYMIKKGHKDGMVATIATLQLMHRLITLDTEYHQVAAILGVETTKNKDLLSSFSLD